MYPQHNVKHNAQHNVKHDAKLVMSDFRDEASMTELSTIEREIRCFLLPSGFETAKSVFLLLQPRQPELVHLHGQLKQVVKTFTLGFGFRDGVTPDITNDCQHNV